MSWSILRPRRPAPTDTSAKRDLLLAEYTELKQEQRLRIGTRDNLLYATLAALAGVLGVAFTGHCAACLLLAPPACLILGWTYHANDVVIATIGAYLRTTLAPRLAALTGTTDVALGWETARLLGPDRELRKVGQLAIDLLAFVVAPDAAIAGYVVLGHGLPVLTAAAALEAALTLLLALRFFTWARHRDRHRSGAVRHAGVGRVREL